MKNKDVIKNPVIINEHLIDEAYLRSNYEYAIREGLFTGTWDDFLELDGIFGPHGPHGTIK